MDIQSLPKEVLFSLFLQVEPKEMRTVCFWKNKKVREICNSKYFQDSYKQKHREVLFWDRFLFPLEKRNRFLFPLEKRNI
tara:strand:+ start:1220 stop:1459 length:240 start_codon:yes stop_codon:yes gene_type:complete